MGTIPSLWAPCAAYEGATTRSLSKTRKLGTKSAKGSQKESAAEPSANVDHVAWRRQRADGSPVAIATPAWADAVPKTRSRVALGARGRRPPTVPEVSCGSDVLQAQLHMAISVNKNARAPGSAVLVARVTTMGRIVVPIGAMDRWGKRLASAAAVPIGLLTTWTHDRVD